MPMKAGTYQGGVRSLEDLRQRCRIDEETGCWLWSMSVDADGMAHLRMLIDGKRRSIKGRRAAVLLSRPQDLTPGRVVYRAPCCPNAHCVRPTHCLVGDQAESQAAAAKRNAPRLQALWAKKANSQVERLRKLTDEQVAEVRASDESDAELGKRFGVRAESIKNIRTFKSFAPRLVANASVFAWKGAA